MTYARETYRRQTLLERVQLYSYIRAGLSEKAALNRVFPTASHDGRRINTNRMARLETWRRLGVFPVNERDLQEAQQMGLISDSPTSPAASETTQDYEEIRAYMRSRLKRTESIPDARTDDRVPTIHVGARVPLDLAAQLKEMPGTVTQNLTQALRLFLEAVRKSA